MTITILIIINVFSALAIIVLALMQTSKGDMGSAFGGGGSQSMFGSRGSANFLSRSTAIMCAVFFISSLSLAYTYAKRSESASVVTSGSVIEQSATPVEADNEIPSIEGLPIIESEAPESNSELPVIESSGAIEEVESLEEELPVIPE